MITPLNPRLFAVLKVRYGEVKIANQGVNAQNSINTYRGKNYVKSSGGEYYRVNCTNCNDQDFKLWVSYQYGQNNPWARTTNLAVCYRCGKNTLDSYVLDMLKDSFHNFGNATLMFNAPQDIQLEETSLPSGVRFPISSLPLDHPAITYLQSRGYNIENLSADYKFEYVEEHGNPNISRRILIPVFHKDLPTDQTERLVGYQTRAIPGFSLLENPKYFTSSGFKKSFCIYNLHVAATTDKIVVCEGVFDAISVGKSGVSLFGKSASLGQISLLRKFGKDKTIVILLDNDAEKESKNLFFRLSSHAKSGIFDISSSLVNGIFNKVVECRLPSGDPGSYSSADLDILITNAINNNG